MLMKGLSVRAFLNSASTEPEDRRLKASSLGAFVVHRPGERNTSMNDADLKALSSALESAAGVAASMMFFIGAVCALKVCETGGAGKNLKWRSPAPGTTIWGEISLS